MNEINANINEASTAERNKWLLEQVMQVQKAGNYFPNLKVGDWEDVRPEVLEMILRVNSTRWYDGYEKGYKDGQSDGLSLNTGPIGSQL
jgi:hypothetical protein